MDKQEYCGFLLLNKPTGISSFDCIRHLKKLCPRQTRIGQTHLSKCTYIRTLMSNVAKHIGTHTTTYTFIRTNIGRFSLKNTVGIKEINKLNDISTHLYKVISL